MPATLAADFTRELINRDYLIQSFLPGVRARETIKTWAPSEVTGFWRSLGEILAMIHTVSATTFGRVIGPHHDSWSQTMRACFLAVADGCDELRLDSSDLRALANLTAENASHLDQIVRAHLLHGDLIPGNVVVDPEHPHRGVTAIFDCDRAWWGDPAADWTMLAVERLPKEHPAGFWTGCGRDLMPVSLLSIVGTQDPRRSAGDGQRLAGKLSRAGAVVTHHVLAVGHSITTEDEQIARKWLRSLPESR